ncbi:MAG: acyl-CoA dehydrogenase family protein [Thermoproteota archaeon]
MSLEESIILQNIKEVCKKISENATKVDSEGRFPRENFDLLASQGYMGAFIPKPYGLELSHKVFVSIVKEIAKACASTAWIYVTHCAATHSFVSTANEKQKENYLPKISNGKIINLAQTENTTGAGLTGIETTAKKVGNYYILNGSKNFITAAHGADIFIIIAKNLELKEQFPKNLSGFIVEKGMSGFEIGQRYDSMGMRGIGWGEIILNDCKVPEENILQDGIKAINSGGHVGMLGASTIAFALAEAAYETCKNHLKQRIIAGQALGQREGVRAVFSEMATALEAIKHMIEFGIDALKRDSYPDLLKVKNFVTENALIIIDKSMRLTGAHGYSKLLPLERYYRDARATLLHFQTLELGKNILGGIAQNI